MCPFHLIYKYEEDEEEYYLSSYDEMHNHILTEDPRIFPVPGKNSARPRFPTPGFGNFSLVPAATPQELSDKLTQLARERCFDLKFVLQSEIQQAMRANQGHEAALEARLHESRGGAPLSEVMF